MRIVKRFEIPSGGWKFQHPVTGMKFPPTPKLDYSLDALIRDVRSHETANRMAGCEDLEARIAEQCALPDSWLSAVE